MTSPLDWLVSMLIVEAVRSQLLNRKLLPDHHNPEVRAAALEVWERGWTMRHGPSGWRVQPIRVTNITVQFGNCHPVEVGDGFLRLS